MARFARQKPRQATPTASSASGPPVVGLLIDSTGALYGTCLNGTTNNGGLFRLPPANGQTLWTETTLWACSGNDGDGAEGAFADKSGVLYGTTSLRGTNGDGVDFSLAGTGFVP